GLRPALCNGPVAMIAMVATEDPPVTGERVAVRHHVHLDIDRSTRRIDVVARSDRPAVPVPLREPACPSRGPTIRRAGWVRASGSCGPRCRSAGTPGPAVPARLSRNRAVHCALGPPLIAIGASRRRPHSSALLRRPRISARFSCAGPRLLLFVQVEELQEL